MGHLMTSILAVKVTLVLTLRPEHLFVFLGKTAGEVGDMDTVSVLSLHFDCAGDGLLLGLDELHNVARVVAESSAAWASRL